MTTQMKRTRLSSRDRRALLAGGAIIATLALVTRGLPRLFEEIAEVKASTRELVTASRRAEHSVRSLPQLSDSAARLTARLSSIDSAYLSGETRASIGASLAALVSEAAMLSETALGPAQLFVDSLDHGGLRTASIRVQVNGDLESIAMFLETLEERPTLLHVTELSLAGSDGPAATGEPERLRGEVVVEGIVREHPVRRRRG